MKKCKFETQMPSRGMPCSLGFIVVLVCAGMLSWSLSANAQIPKSEPEALDNRIVAKVGDYSISAQEVSNRLARVGRLEERFSSSQIEKLKSATLDAIIDQCIVHDFLKTRRKSVDSDEVQLQLDVLIADLATVEKNLDDYLREKKTSKKELLRKIVFDESWKRYLKDKLNDENLEKYYKSNARRFDGTQVRVAHLILKKSKTGSSEKQVKQAANILEELKSEQLSWPQALEKYSEGTKENGGEVGWIGGKPVMPSEFTDAAMKLQLAELSEPVETAFGVHIIRCLEVKPGKIGFRDARKAIEAEVREFLFKQIVEQHRNKVKIERFDD